MRSIALGVLVLVGCKGGGEKPKECPKEPAKECPPADADPDYLHVDRDQLSALCLGSRLPAPSYPSDYAALVTPDGKRLPWLLVWSNADQPLQEPKVLHAPEWVGAAKAYIARQLHAFEKPPEEGERTGKQWLNILCGGDETYRVVVTGALFEKKGAHAIAIRGDKVLDETLPAGARDEEVFAKAIELTNTLVGGPIQLAKHRLAANPEYLDIAGPWRTALGMKP